jgi:tRNA pseudouridine55 synthase
MPRGTDGILNIDKPAGLTSHDVVAAVRRMSHQTRVGHAGTLDPMATGVLLVCIGQATRVVEYLTDHDKKYHAHIRLGVETDTYDATGRIVAEHPLEVTPDQVEPALRALTGKIEQRPPAYSALKQNGVPLYRLARQGMPVETEPRQVEIYSIDVTRMDLPDLEIDIHCSKGTYIRSLAHDLGAALGCGAHLTALIRTAVGQFTLADSITLDRLRDAFLHGYAGQLMSPLDEALLQFEAVILEPDVAQRVQQGNALACEREYSTPLLRAYSTRGELVALLERGEGPGFWKPRKVFVS